MTRPFVGGGWLFVTRTLAVVQLTLPFDFGVLCCVFFVINRFLLDWHHSECRILRYGLLVLENIRVGDILGFFALDGRDDFGLESRSKETKKTRYQWIFLRRKTDLQEFSLF